MIFVFITKGEKFEPTSVSFTPERSFFHEDSKSGTPKRKLFSRTKLIFSEKVASSRREGEFIVPSVTKVMGVHIPWSEGSTQTKHMSNAVHADAPTRLLLCLAAIGTRLVRVSARLAAGQDVVMYSDQFGKSMGS
ncbi:hypothetical protein EVAR_2295_1 [Eumeta japonica]|uniref:Uncharacterized protein n=1 Tax=Eumeta variegata TaxID=151549 RepID=A0A4C1SFZ9_EUMVA|nr:hypothetical protein EVAR_2295_1 [Eumeta japonica]